MFHCDKCDMCLLKVYKATHACRADMLRKDCPVCLEVRRPYPPMLLVPLLWRHVETDIAWLQWRCSSTCLTRGQAARGCRVAIHCTARAWIRCSSPTGACGMRGPRAVAQPVPARVRDAVSPRVCRLKCPLCSKSILRDMSRFNRMKDLELASTIMPPEYARHRRRVLCNDCEKVRGVCAFVGIALGMCVTAGFTTQESVRFFHVAGHKCSHCGGYNTQIIAGAEPVARGQVCQVASRHVTRV